MTRSAHSPSRLYVDAPLEHGTLRLDAEQAHYLGRVLRCREGQRIVVFNARGQERFATIQSLAKRNPSIALGESLEPVPESPARIVLLQSLAKSDAMDLVVQKATELGAEAVFAVKTDFSVVRLDDERRGRRLAHWRRVALSACEQSGRHCPPAIEAFGSLDAAIAALPEGSARIAFGLGGSNALANAVAAKAATGGSEAIGSTAASGALAAVGREAIAPEAIAPEAVALAIGPEGGFSPNETTLLEQAGFAFCTLGPRTLRAETAAVAAMACVQMLAGDLSPAQGGTAPVD